MSALRTALRPALTPALGSARRGVSRYFTTFDAVAQSKVTLSSTVSLLSDYAISFDVHAPYSDAMVVLGNSTQSFRNVIFISNGNIFLRDDSSVSIETTTAPIPENKLSRIEIFRVSGNVEVFINEVSVLTSAHGNMMFNQLGARNANELYFDGIIANVTIKDNGATILNMPINRYYTPQNNIVLDESGNGNNGTFVNIAAGRSKYYQQRADGNFVDLQGNVLEVAY